MFCIYKCAAGMSEGYFKKFTRRKSSAAAIERAEPTSLTVYDWLFYYLVNLRLRAYSYSL